MIINRLNLDETSDVRVRAVALQSLRHTSGSQELGTDLSGQAMPGRTTGRQTRAFVRIRDNTRSNIVLDTKAFWPGVIGVSCGSSPESPLVVIGVRSAAGSSASFDTVAHAAHGTRSSAFDTVYEADVERSFAELRYGLVQSLQASADTWGVDSDVIPAAHQIPP